MAELSIAEQDELFEKFDELNDAEKTALLEAMMKPYWSLNVPRDRMDRMRTNVILAIIIGMTDKFEENMVSAWASIARNFVPPLSDEDIDKIIALMENDEKYALEALHVSINAHFHNPEKYTDERIRLPLPESLNTATLLGSPNPIIRSVLYDYLEKKPHSKFIFDGLVEFSKEKKMTSEEEARFDLIETKVECARIEREQKEKTRKVPVGKILDIKSIVVDRTPLTKERSQYVIDLANCQVGPEPEGMSDLEYERIIEEMNDEIDEFPKTSKSPEELHLFVSAYNWDMGLGPMKSVVENKFCDRNTALLVFWLGQPTLYQNYDFQDVKNDFTKRDGWRLVRDIRSRIYEGFLLRETEMPDDYKKFTVDQIENAKWDIHDLMYGK